MPIYTETELLLKDNINTKLNEFKKTLTKVKIKKLYIALALVVLIMAAVATGIFSHAQKPGEKPVPSISIGCDRVLWKGMELELAASTQNINKPLFNWTVDGKDGGGSQRLNKNFEMGEHQVVLNVAFDGKTLTAKQTTLVIDSVDGVSLRDSEASKNQWGFQTIYTGKNYGVKGVTLSVDSSPQTEVNPCGYLSTKSLMAGDHTWKAVYQGKTIASGTFNIKEVSEIKITRIEVAPSYNAGDTVNGKIVLMNSGSSIVKGFDIKTLVVNNNYAWMGDAAKREFSDTYSSDLEPGEVYEVPITVTIPEKVSGIRPSGRYSITVTLLLNGQIIDTKVVNTEVK